MAKADDTSNPAITAQSPSTFIPLRRTSQCNQHPGCATLYLDSSAASEDLFDTARRRLESAIGTLSVLDLLDETCLLYTSPSPRDRQKSRMPSSA